jgi:hypothetical protein
MSEKQKAIAEFIAAVRRDGSAPAELQQKLADLLGRGRGQPANLKRLAELRMAMIVREFAEFVDPPNTGPTVDEVIRKFVGDDPDGKKFEAMRKAWYNKNLQAKVTEEEDVSRIYDIAQCYDSAQRASYRYEDHFGTPCPSFQALKCEYWKLAGTILWRIKINKPFPMA